MKAGRACARPAGHQGRHRSAEASRSRTARQREYYASHPELLAKTRASTLERYRVERDENPLRRKAKNLLAASRSRAKRDGLPCDLTLEWVERELASVIENGCPLLGIEVRLDTDRIAPGSPTIDKFNPDRGYTQENCWVISHRANSTKQNATLDFMRRILEYADTRFAVENAVE
jgi:hypothetical protein